MINNSINTKTSIQTSVRHKYYGKLNNKFTLIEKIGKGATSSVFSAQLLDDSNQRDKLYAIKVCKKTWSTKIFNEEGRIMKHFSSADKHIITFYESEKGILNKFNKQTSKFVYYHVFELADNSELFDFIKATNKGFGEKQARILFMQIISAVQTCHERGITHKDIKTENVLLTVDYQCKLSDFGLSIETKRKQALFANAGTDGFFPPEVHTNKHCDSLHYDLFALGITLFIIVCGFKPFTAAKRLDPQYRRIWKGNYDLYWAELPGQMEFSESFKQLINQMLALNPDDRLTIEGIQLSKWVNDCEITQEDRLMLRKEFEARKPFVDEYRKYKHTKKGK